MRGSNRSLPSSEVVVIGYGPLMSGLGLLPLGHLRVRAAACVRLENARRGFSKLSQQGERFALILEPIDPQQPIASHTVPPATPPHDAPEALALTVQPTDLARLCDHDGYSSGALQRLRQEAAAVRQDLAAFLWTLLNDVGLDIATFRQRLFKLIGYTSPHYIPHPVRLDANRFAVTFVAPGHEGTGSDRVVPSRTRTHDEQLLTALEAWQRKPNRTQLSHLTACLLGGLHGIGVQDLLVPVAEDAELCERLRAAIAAEQPQELARFLSATGLDHGSYWQAFGSPNHSIRRSGLEQFLRQR